VKRAWWLLALAACGNDFDPASRVNDFRLLAVAADKPYAAPGETVKLTTLAHEPFGRPVTWAWTTCPLPADSTVNACLARYAELAREGRTPPFVVGPNPSYEVTIPPNLFDGIAQTENQLFGVLTIGCPGVLSPRETNVVGELPFQCVDGGQVLPFERWVVSVKRIFLFRRDKNANPGIGRVTWDGADWPEAEVKEVGVCAFDSNTYGDCKGERHDLVVTPAADAVEAGTDENGRTFREAVVVQYYATEGVFEFDAKTVDAPATRWAARTRSQGQNVDMWFVVRDNRGGVTWTTRRVRVR